MPHLTIQYSQNLEGHLDVSALCEDARLAMLETGTFPLGGIRVRAHPVKHYAIGDAHADNSFVDLILRMGIGRDHDTKHAAGAAIMAVAEHHAKPFLDTGFCAVALEIVEIDKDLSWKTNTIHSRIANR